MSALSRPKALNLDPDQLQAGLKRGDMVLVDVREPDEHKAERIAGALSQPLSRFDPAALTAYPGKTVVLHCAGGVRSAKGLDTCHRAGVSVTHHLAGGITAWKACGLPTIR
jgi:rhodanese-related sulfurtransferase